MYYCTTWSGKVTVRVSVLDKSMCVKLVPSVTSQKVLTSMPCPAELVANIQYYCMCMVLKPIILSITCLLFFKMADIPGHSVAITNMCATKYM